MKVTVPESGKVLVDPAPGVATNASDIETNSDDIAALDTRVDAIEDATYQTQINDNAAAIVDLQSIVELPADFTTSSNVNSSIPNFAASLGSNSTYLVEYFLVMSQAGIDAGHSPSIKIDWTSADIAVGTIQDHNGVNRMEAGIQEDDIDLETADEDHLIYMRWFVKTNATAIVENVQARIEAVNMTYELTIKAGSILKITKLNA